MEIVKTCKKHGELNIDQVVKEKNDKYILGFYYRCRECRYPKNHWEKENIQKTCDKHGKLDKENIRIKNRLLICRLCQHEERRLHKENNRQRLNEQTRKYYHQDLDKSRQRSKDQYRKFRTRAMETHIRTTYGLQADEYWKMVEEQKNLCKICNRPETRKWTKKSDLAQEACRLTIDHDHKTGIVRGLLCHGCNTGLGKFKDDPELLLKAIDYLRLHHNAT